jgi:hypothetical protein
MRKTGAICLSLAVGSSSLGSTSMAATGRVNRSRTRLGFLGIQGNAALTLDIGGNRKVDARSLLATSGI